MDTTDGQPASATGDLAALEPFRRFARFLFAILALMAAVGVVLVPIGVGLDPARLPPCGR